MEGHCWARCLWDTAEVVCYLNIHLWIWQSILPHGSFMFDHKTHNFWRMDAEHCLWQRCPFCGSGNAVIQVRTTGTTTPTAAPAPRRRATHRNDHHHLMFVRDDNLLFPNQPSGTEEQGDRISLANESRVSNAVFLFGGWKYRKQNWENNYKAIF